MHGTAIARNYAETLLALAHRHGGSETVDEYARALEELTALFAREPRIREFLESPLVEAAAKKQALRKALAGRLPELLIRFLLVVVDKRRAVYLRQIAAQYSELVDQMHGRVRPDVLLAREPDEALRRDIRDSLQRLLGQEVLPTYRVRQELIGGIVVRVDGRVFDGSIRRRASELRRRMLATRLPRDPAFYNSIGGRRGPEG